MVSLRVLEFLLFSFPSSRVPPPHTKKPSFIIVHVHLSSAASALDVAYVSTEGGTDINNCNATLPCYTLAKAFGEATTVIAGPGTYQYSSSDSIPYLGSSAASLVGDGSNSTIFDFQHNTIDRLFAGSEASSFELHGFTVANVTTRYQTVSYDVNSSGTGVNVTDVVLDSVDTTSTSSYVHLSARGSDDLLVDGLTVVNGSFPGTGTPSLYFRASNRAEISNIEVQDAVFGSEAIYVTAQFDASAIENVTLSNLSATKGIYVFGNNVDVSLLKNIIIEDGVFSDDIMDFEAASLYSIMELTMSRLSTTGFIISGGLNPQVSSAEFTDITSTFGVHGSSGSYVFSDVTIENVTVSSDYLVSFDSNGVSTPDAQANSVVVRNSSSRNSLIRMMGTAHVHVTSWTVADSNVTDDSNHGVLIAAPSTIVNITVTGVDAGLAALSAGSITSATGIMVYDNGCASGFAEFGVAELGSAVSTTFELSNSYLAGGCRSDSGDQSDVQFATTVTLENTVIEALDNDNIAVSCVEGIILNSGSSIHAVSSVVKAYFISTDGTGTINGNATVIECLSFEEPPTCYACSDCPLASNSTCFMDGMDGFKAPTLGCRTENVLSPGDDGPAATMSSPSAVILALATLLTLMALN